MQQNITPLSNSHSQTESGMSGKENILIVVAGPTAIGKTDLGIEIARHYNTEIISADSRQFFREMSIGTAKPSPAELNIVEHHFINSHSIHDEISVGSYEKEALALLENLFKKHPVVVMVGGSGLYINAIINGFDNLPDVKEEIRTQLNQRLITEGITPLQKELQEIDPKYFAEVDINNPQRIIRALEVYYSTGKPFSSYRTGEKKKRPFKTILIGLNSDREKLYNRINQRVDLMIEKGLLDEVESLYNSRHLNSLNTVGYSEIFDYLDNKISLEQAIENIKQNTRRFAKRQITWFKKTENLKWFEPEQKDNVFNYLDELLNRKEL